MDSYIALQLSQPQPRFWFTNHRKRKSHRVALERSQASPQEHLQSAIKDTQLFILSTKHAAISIIRIAFCGLVSQQSLSVKNSQRRRSRLGGWQAVSEEKLSNGELKCTLQSNLKIAFQSARCSCRMGREKRIYAVHLHMFRRLREMPIESETRSSEKRRQSIVKHRVRRCKTNGDKCETQSRILHADLQIARFWLSAHSPKHERLSNDPCETGGERKET